MFSWETNIQYDIIQKVYIAILLSTTSCIHFPCVLSLMKWDGIVMCFSFFCEMDFIYTYSHVCV